MRSRFCRVCAKWHDVDEPWPIECRQHFPNQSPQIIKDIDPYRAVGVDIATGKTPLINSRSDHRQYLKRNGYVEIGNEPIRERKWEYNDVNPREIAQTIDQLRSRNG